MSKSKEKTDFNQYYPDDLVIDPYTGIYVGVDTKRGKVLQNIISQCNKCPETKIYNIRSKKCVSHKSKTGKLLQLQIDFCRKYREVKVRLNKDDKELIEKVGNIRFPSKFIGKSFRLRDIVNKNLNDDVIQKLLKKLGIENIISNKSLGAVVVVTVLSLFDVVLSNTEMKAIALKQLVALLSRASSSAVKGILTGAALLTNTKLVANVMQGFSFSKLLTFTVATIESLVRFIFGYNSSEILRDVNLSEKYHFGDNLKQIEGRIMDNTTLHYMSSRGLLERKEPATNLGSTAQIRPVYDLNLTKLQISTDEVANALIKQIVMDRKTGKITIQYTPKGTAVTKKVIVDPINVVDHRLIKKDYIERLERMHDFIVDYTNSIDAKLVIENLKDKSKLTNEQVKMYNRLKADDDLTISEREQGMYNYFANEQLLEKIKERLQEAKKGITPNTINIAISQIGEFINFFEQELNKWTQPSIAESLSSIASQSEPVTRSLEQRQEAIMPVQYKPSSVRGIVAKKESSTLLGSPNQNDARLLIQEM